MANIQNENEKILGYDLLASMFGNYLFLNIVKPGKQDTLMLEFLISRISEIENRQEIILQNIEEIKKKLDNK